MLQSTTPRASRPASLPRDLRFDDDVTAFAGDASGRRSALPLGVVRPTDTAQVERLLRWANKAQVPLIPVSSRGGPRRRGDTLGEVPAMVVDVSGMNRVIHVDGRDGVAVIEPGVTFDELDVAIAPHGLVSFRPLLPRASKSVLAAFLEREPFTIPGHHWDSADPLGGLEVVFGNGERFRTGGAALPGTLEENLARGNRQLLASGPGQTDFGRALQGAQGSLGIVTWSAILCLRRPAITVPLFVTADTLAPVVASAYAMLRQRFDGHLFIVNAAQLALMLASDLASYKALQARLPAWTMLIELTAPRWFGDEAIAYRRADLQAAADAAGASVGAEVEGTTAVSVASRIGRSTETPYKDNAGRAQQEVFFVSRLSRAEAQIGAVADIAPAADLPVYLQPMTQGVNAHVEFTFFADTPAAANATARAAAERLAHVGAFFSRPYHPWGDIAFAHDPGIVPMLARTKAIFDPVGVLQPGSQALGQALGQALDRSFHREDAR